MFSKLEDTIKYLATLCWDNPKSDDALKYSQAALNLAHTYAMMMQATKS